MRWLKYFAYRTFFRDVQVKIKNKLPADPYGDVRITVEWFVEWGKLPRIVVTAIPDPALFEREPTGLDGITRPAGGSRS